MKTKKRQKKAVVMEYKEDPTFEEAQNYERKVIIHSVTKPS